MTFQLDQRSFRAGPVTQSLGQRRKQQFIDFRAIGFGRRSNEILGPNAIQASFKCDRGRFKIRAGKIRRQHRGIRVVVSRPMRQFRLKIVRRAEPLQFRRPQTRLSSRGPFGPLITRSVD